MKLKCQIVTPEKTLYDAESDFVALPLFDGEIGILPNHSPLVGRLGLGELRTKVGNAEERFYIEGGFVQVNNSVVSVLTPKACPVSELNVANLESQLATATPENQLKIKTQLRIAGKK